MDQEKEYKLEYIKYLRNLLAKITFEEYRSLPLVCTIAATLVSIIGIISPFNHLIENFSFFKLSLIIFLITIPLSLISFLRNLYRDQEQLNRRFEEEIGRIKEGEIKEIEKITNKENEGSIFTKILNRFLLHSHFLTATLITLGTGLLIASFFSHVLIRRIIIGISIAVILFFWCDKFWPK
jgi:F0F1-type ATP synthase assembly protein I